MKKKLKVWLARNGCHGKKYVLSVGMPMERVKPSQAHSFNCSIAWILPSDDAMTICSEPFEKVAPKSCHLKPGEGPVKIDITIRRKK